jgi:hypothetical protein
MSFEVRWSGADGKRRKGRIDTAVGAAAEAQQLDDDGYKNIEVEDTTTHVVYWRETIGTSIRRGIRNPANAPYFVTNGKKPASSSGSLGQQQISSSVLLNTLQSVDTACFVPD